ncbi:MAG: fluoride efflux transporter CrcB [Bacteroidia bacterium]
MQALLLIFLGGGLGSLARFGVTLAVRQFPAAAFPLATLAANVLACIVMGIVLWQFAARPADAPVKLFLITGFCGGFSTFSTFSFETLELFRRGHAALGVLNITISIALCIAVLALLVRKNISV